MTSRHHRQWLALAAIILVAVALRVGLLDRDPLWSDEALTIVLARWPLGEALWWPTDPTPPLYYALHKWLLPASAPAPVMRSIACVAGILLVPVSYAAGRLLLSRSGGLLVAALVATSAPLIDFSGEARAYSLLVLLVTGSATALIWWIVEVERAGRVTSRAVSALALFATTTLLAFYTHVTAIAWIGAAVAILLIHLDRRRLPGMVAPVATACVAMGVLAVPGLVRLSRALSVSDHFNWLAQASITDFAAVMASLILPFAQGAERAHAIAPRWLALQVGMALATLWLAKRAWAQLREQMRGQPFGWAVVAALVATPLVLWLMGFVSQPVFMPRTALIALPALAVVAAAVVTGQPSRLLIIALAATLPLASLLSVLLLETGRSREDWRGTADALGSHVRSGDIVLVCAVWKYPALRHALSSALPAPAIAPFADRLLLLEDRFGGAADWDRRFFTSYVRPSARAQMQGDAVDEQPRTVIVARAGASIWLMNSECRSEDRKVFDRAIGGPPDWTKVWPSPVKAGGGAITLLRHRVTADMRLVVGRPRDARP